MGWRNVYEPSDKRCTKTTKTSSGRARSPTTIGPTARALASSSGEFQKLVNASPQRPAYLGDLEAVSWTPPCESQHSRWTLDVWYLLAFDGRIGSGRSFLCDLEANQVVAVRDFSVRTS